MMTIEHNEGRSDRKGALESLSSNVTSKREQRLHQKRQYWCEHDTNTAASVNGIIFENNYQEQYYDNNGMMNDKDQSYDTGMMKYVPSILHRKKKQLAFDRVLRHHERDISSNSDHEASEILLFHRCVLYSLAGIILLLITSIVASGGAIIFYYWYFDTTTANTVNTVNVNIVPIGNNQLYYNNTIINNNNKNNSSSRNSSIKNSQQQQVEKHRHHENDFIIHNETTSNGITGNGNHHHHHNNTHTIFDDNDNDKIKLRIAIDITFPSLHCDFLSVGGIGYGDNNKVYYSLSYLDTDNNMKEIDGIQNNVRSFDNTMTEQWNTLQLRTMEEFDTFTKKQILSLIIFDNGQNTILPFQRLFDGTYSKYDHINRQFAEQQLSAKIAIVDCTLYYEELCLPFQNLTSSAAASSLSSSMKKELTKLNRKQRWFVNGIPITTLDNNDYNSLFHDSIISGNNHCNPLQQAKSFFEKEGNQNSTNISSTTNDNQQQQNNDQYQDIITNSDEEEIFFKFSEHFKFSPYVHVLQDQQDAFNFVISSSSNDNIDNALQNQNQRRQTINKNNNTSSKPPKAIFLQYRVYKNHNIPIVDDPITRLWDDYAILVNQYFPNQVQVGYVLCKDLNSCIDMDESTVQYKWYVAGNFIPKLYPMNYNSIPSLMEYTKCQLTLQQKNGYQYHHESKFYLPSLLSCLQYRGCRVRGTPIWKVGNSGKSKESSYDIHNNNKSNSSTRIEKNNTKQQMLGRLQQKPKTYKKDSIYLQVLDPFFQDPFERDVSGINMTHIINELSISILNPVVAEYEIDGGDYDVQINKQQENNNNNNASIAAATTTTTSSLLGKQKQENKDTKYAYDNTQYSTFGNKEIIHSAILPYRGSYLYKTNFSLHQEERMKQDDDYQKEQQQHADMDEKEKNAEDEYYYYEKKIQINEENIVGTSNQINVDHQGKVIFDFQLDIS